MAPSYKDESPAVQAHLEMSQNIISRMAANSASCKAWCIALVSAILVVVAEKNRPRLMPIALLPTLLFFVLDTYYLSLEQRFRSSYNSFIEKLHYERVDFSDIYVIAPTGKASAAFLKAMTSFSIWPFYGALVILVIIGLCIL